MSTMTREEEYEETHRRNMKVAGYWFCFDCDKMFAPNVEPTFVDKQKICDSCVDRILEV